MKTRDTNVKKLIGILIKLSLTILFWFVIDRLTFFFLGNFIPVPTNETIGQVLYVAITLIELAVAYFCTFLVYQPAKNDKEN